MPPPLVSIIIPSHNSLHTLDETLESAVNQSYENIEVILVDDGSTDDTKRFFTRFEKMDIKCIFQENSGGSSARNTGLSNAKGEYVQFLDADDVLHQDKIKKQIQAMDKEDSELSFSVWRCFSDDIHSGNARQLSLLDQYSHVDYSRKRTGKELMISFGTDDWFVPTVAWLTKTSLIRKAGFWNPSVKPNEDGEYFSRVLFFSNKVTCVDEVLAFYRVLESESTSTLNSKQKILGSFKSWQLIHALVNTSSNTHLLSYPKNAYRILYNIGIAIYPREAKIIAREFDKIEEACFLPEKKLYLWLIDMFGLHSGSKIYTVYLRIINLPNSLIKKVIKFFERDI